MQETKDLSNEEYIQKQKDEIDALLDEFDRRREKVLAGGVNCIPIPKDLEAFSSEFPGIEQGTYYLVTGAAKSAKTQITSYLFLYNAINFAYNHPDKVRVKIYYFPLEESKPKIQSRFMSYLLYTKSNGKLRISPRDLRSIDLRKVKEEDKKYVQELRKPEYLDILYFFNTHVEIIKQKNPTAIWATALRHAEKHGKIIKKKDVFNGVETEYITDYIPNDPDEYVIFIWDHVSLTESERGWDLKKCIDKLSEYCKDLRDIFNFIPVLVQQQNMDTISLDAYKQKKIMPTLAGLADSKNTGKDASMMLGITNPDGFEIKEYRGYNTDRMEGLGGYARFLEAVLSREGESNGYLALYFDGATNFFVPLPKPNETVKLAKVQALINKNMGITK